MPDLLVGIDRIRGPYERVDRRITAALARASVPVLRIGLGAVFLWFGVL